MSTDRRPSRRRTVSLSALLLACGLGSVPLAAAEPSGPAGPPPSVRAASLSAQGPVDLHSTVTPPDPGAPRSGPDGRFEQLTEGLELLAHVPFEQGTEMQFQRREGPHRRAGAVVTGPRDYAFLGSEASHFASAGATAPADGIGFRIVDVTVPAEPEVLAEVACPGHISAVAVHEDLLLQGVERPSPFYGQEGAPSNRGCAAQHDPQGLDVPGAAGVRVFDVSDPAAPVLVRFVQAREFGGGGVHNVSVVPWAGLAYLSTFTLLGPSPRQVYVDLEDPSLPVTVLDLRDISATASSECHDIAFDPVRRLGFCGAFEQGHVWDLSDARRPRGLVSMTNDGVFHYHGMRLAPDGRTLVVAAEQTGPDELVLDEDTGIGGNSCTGSARSGALWFYDLGAGPGVTPRLLGTFAPSTAMPTKGFCTAHQFNFVDEDRLVAGWMEGGTFVVDFSRLPGLRGVGSPSPLSVAEQQAWSLPVGSSTWTGYYWHGRLFSLALGGTGGGLWVLSMDGLPDVPPAPQDEGTAWGRWTPSAPDGACRGPRARCPRR